MRMGVTAVRDRLKTIGGSLTRCLGLAKAQANGKRQMEKGKWQMANVKWQMANGKRQMEKGKWQMAKAKRQSRRDEQIHGEIGLGKGMLKDKRIMIR